jgi:hypothetical protein
MTTTKGVVIARYWANPNMSFRKWLGLALTVAHSERRVYALNMR